MKLERILTLFGPLLVLVTGIAVAQEAHDESYLVGTWVTRGSIGAWISPEENTFLLDLDFGESIYIYRSDHTAVYVETRTPNKQWPMLWSLELAEGRFGALLTETSLSRTDQYLISFVDEDHFTKISIPANMGEERCVVSAEQFTRQIE